MNVIISNKIFQYKNSYIHTSVNKYLSEFWEDLILCAHIILHLHLYTRPSFFLLSFYITYIKTLNYQKLY